LIISLGFGLEDEIVIIEVKPRMYGVNDEPGKNAYKLDYYKDVYTVNQPITRKPEYLAIRDPEGNRIELIFKIDQGKSNFAKGQIVPQGNPIRALIPLRLQNTSSTGNKVWYSSFRALVTHGTTDEFSEEKRILCNGYYCIHFSYCKFYNNSVGMIFEALKETKEE
jgi:hypothetical protein